MADEVWEEDSPVMVQSYIDPGRSFGRGRGFIPQERSSVTNNGPGSFAMQNEDEWKEDTSGTCDDYENNDNNNFRKGNGDFRGRGGNRGRGGGRGGRGGGRGGSSDDSGNSYRDRQNNDNDDGGRFRRNRNNEDDETNGDSGSKSKDNDDGKPRELYIPPEPSEDESVMFAGGISSGINFDKYDAIHVKVTGDCVPRAIDNFETSGLREFVLDNVKKSGYSKPTPVQKNALPIIMAGRDLMACAQTGSGKTAAFLLPIINMMLSDPRDLIQSSQHCEPQALIISPTRELTLQIFNEARKFSHGSIIRAVVAYGGVAGFYQAQNVLKGCHILVATPGRLNDFVEKGRVTFSSLRFLVLDEADRMLDMGFLPAVERVLSHPTMVETGVRQTLMFSATFPEDVQHLAGKFLKDYLFLAVGVVGGACSDVEQRFHLVAKFDKRPKLTELLTQEGGEKTLVFVEMKRTADFIAAYLSEHDFPTTSIHGDRLQREREEALGDFKTGRMGVLVATAVAARGLDIKNVSHVVNYDLPKSIDEYVHRIGRTGRVGNRGKATSFYDPQTDAPLAKDLVKILQQADQEVPSWLEKDASGSFSSFSGSSRFGGRDVRKFDGGGSDEPDSTFGGSSGYAHSQPQPLEPEEEW